MKDFLKEQLKEIPYFRATLRAVEASYYQTLDLVAPALDIGCGDGHFATQAFNRIIEIGIDPVRKSLCEAAQLHRYNVLVQGEGKELPFPDDWLGSAVSNSVFEHIEHIDEVLKELSRVLRPEAYLIFCVPNDGYLKELSLSRVFGKGYTRWFKRVTRVWHADDPRIWKERLQNTGFILEKTWNYFPPSALHMLEWGHYFGLPSLIIKWLTGRWILVPADWNIRFTEVAVRKYASPEPCADGVFTFYIARKYNKSNNH
jgi:SAM-dependent methyltransferase